MAKSQTTRKIGKIGKAASLLPKLLEKELNKLLLCEKCYQNENIPGNESITMLCNPPHLLLWVNCGEYGYWPAKLIRYKSKEDVTVRYFGDWSIDTVYAENCKMFSKQSPVNEHGPGAGTPFQLALKVIRLTIRNLRHYLKKGMPFYLFRKPTNTSKILKKHLVNSNFRNRIKFSR